MNSTHTSDRMMHFRSLSEEICALIETQGYVVRPYSSPSLPHFANLPEDEQENVLHFLTDYLKISKKLVQLSPDVTDGESLKTVFDYYGYSFDPQVLEILKSPGYVIEVYRTNHFQEFRSFNYFRLTSYTIEDIYCRRWMDLYDRDERITEKIFYGVNNVFKSREMSFLMPEAHSLRERATLERLEIFVHSLFITPLMKGDEIVAIVSVVHVEF